MSKWQKIEKELEELSQEENFYGYSNISSWLDEKVKNLENRKLKAELELCSKICFMMLIPASMNEPLKERMNFFEYGRSARPEDLSEEEIEVLDKIYDNLANAWLKARVAEILWLVKKPKNINWIQTAIDCYLSMKETKENWFKDIRICHERAFF